MDYQNILSNSDPLLDEVIFWTVRQKKISISILEKQFHIAYLRAASLLRSMEDLHVIEKINDGKERRIIMNEDSYLELKTGIDVISNAIVHTKATDPELLEKMFRFVEKQSRHYCCNSEPKIKLIRYLALELRPNHYKFYYLYSGKLYGAYVDFCPRINDFNTIVEFIFNDTRMITSKKELSILKQAIATAA